MHLFGSLGKGFHQFLLNVAGLNLYNVVVYFGHGKIQHISSLNVRCLLEHCHQLGDVEELGKTSFGSVTATVRSKLNGRYCLTKGGCPRIKVKKPAQLKLIVLKVFLHRVKLYHRVGDRGSRCKHTSLSTCQFVKITALHIEVGGFLCFSLRYTRHVSHLGVCGKVLVEVCLIHKQAVNAKLLKGHDVILSALVVELFQLGLDLLLGFCKLLGRYSVTARLPYLLHTLQDLVSFFIKGFDLSFK